MARVRMSRELDKLWDDATGTSLRRSRGSVFQVTVALWRRKDSSMCICVSSMDFVKVGTLLILITRLPTEIL